MTRRKLVAGNWKMNGLAAALSELASVAHAAPNFGDRVDVLLCPPATLLHKASEIAGDALKIGGQTCHPAEKGAHTGEISAEMLADAGARYVIVGHSERRADNGESDSDVASRATAAIRAGLTPIVCVGETEAERDSGRTLDILGGQIDGSIPEDLNISALVVAYEPVWAIGTGRTPSADDVREVHAFLRSRLASRFGAEAAASIPLLYGGSVKPENAAELLSVADVDGALVGGASLKASDFIAICEAASRL